MQETAIIASKIDSDYFFYDKEDVLFHQEASSLPEHFNPVSQIWNDSADSGFVMVGQKTGKELIFFEKSEIRNSENEITHWQFVAEPAFNKKLISKPVKLVIWND